MSSAAITLEVLPAAFGDCLLISCPVGRRVWRMLVDTGPDETYPSLRARLLQIPKDANGRRSIDLFVITHIDHDHIGAASLLLNDRALGLNFGDIWFNAPPRPLARGVAEGEGLAELLGAQESALPWNAAWSGQPVSTPADGGGVELRGRGLPTLTLLSPTPKRLDDLYRVWAKELARLRRKERPAAEPEPAARRGIAPTLEALAAQVTPTDSSVPNGSSIAFLVEHRGASLLLAADAFPTVLVPALKALAHRRRLSRRLKVDALKLSHHGSRANVTQDLLDAVEAKHYIVSTNNAYFNHPNDEAMARVILRGGAPTVWFNYDTPKNRHWGDEQLVARYGYAARFPDRSGQGVTIALPRKLSRAAARD